MYKTIVIARCKYEILLNFFNYMLKLITTGLPRVDFNYHLFFSPSELEILAKCVRMSFGKMLFVVSVFESEFGLTSQVRFLN